MGFFPSRINAVTVYSHCYPQILWITNPCIPKPHAFTGKALWMKLDIKGRQDGESKENLSTGDSGLDKIFGNAL